MPVKPCKGRFGTCPNTVPIGQKYCPDCAPRELRKEVEHKRENYRIYNATKRDPQVRRWMTSKRYKDARARFLALNPLCAECIKDRPHWPGSGRPVAATILDHIIPHKGNATLFWDQSNWQGLCFTCHNRKTNSKDGGFGNPLR